MYLCTWFFYSYNMEKPGPIGVFDSGYGGLTVLKDIVGALPQYDYIYFGDNARAPYGPRSFDTIYHYTLECVNWLFSQGCSLVILACNTASAKALRTIQQNDLTAIGTSKRVLGVIRPTTEILGNFSKTGEVGILGTKGTVSSNSYVIEIEKFFPTLKVYQQACPMLVPLIENSDFENEGADYFIKQYLNNLFSQSERIDTLLLACTHYPVLEERIKQFMPKGVAIISQGAIVANSLKNYLLRHPEIEKNCSKNGSVSFFTTDSVEDFNSQGSLFYGKPVHSSHIDLIKQ